MDSLDEETLEEEDDDDGWPHSIAQPRGRKRLGSDGRLQPLLLREPLPAASVVAASP